jgi:predicted XRE-type DNA-binding protein
MADKMDDDFELTRGSGNVYQDFGHPNSGLEQARAIICSKIIQVMDDNGLSTRDAEKLTGVSHTEFSRIRNAKLGKFTLDRIITILEKLDQQVEIRISFDSRPVMVNSFQSVHQAVA